MFSFTCAVFWNIIFPFTCTIQFSSYFKFLTLLNYVCVTNSVIKSCGSGSINISFKKPIFSKDIYLYTFFSMKEYSKVALLITYIGPIFLSKIMQTYEFLN